MSELKEGVESMKAELEEKPASREEQTNDDTGDDNKSILLK